MCRVGALLGPALKIPSLPSEAIVLPCAGGRLLSSQLGAEKRRPHVIIPVGSRRFSNPCTCLKWQRMAAAIQAFCFFLSAMSATSTTTVTTRRNSSISHADSMVLNTSPTGPRPLLLASSATVSPDSADPSTGSSTSTCTLRLLGLYCSAILSSRHSSF